MGQFDKYGKKTKALERFWQHLIKDAAANIKIAFEIWKEEAEIARKQKLRVKKLLFRLYFRKVGSAFSIWFQESKFITS